MSYLANAFGLFDTSGNVWEWTQDCWKDHYSGAPDNGAARQGCQAGKGNRVIRGGSWNDGSSAMRSTYRYRGGVDHYFNYVGMRLSLNHVSTSP